MMCGIFGYIGKADKEIVKEISLLAGERGFHSFGISYIKNEKLITKKYPGKIEDRMEVILRVESEVMIGQARLATSSDPVLKNTAPFSDDKLSVVHNGNIYNYKEIAKHFHFKMKTKTDSEVLMPIIQFSTIDKFVKWNYAIAFIEYLKEKKRKNIQLSFIRSGLPIFKFITDNCLYFCSKKFNSSELIKERKIYGKKISAKS